MKAYLVELYTTLIHFQKPEAQWGLYNYQLDPRSLSGFLQKRTWASDGFADGGHKGKFLRKHCSRPILVAIEPGPRVNHETPYTAIYRVDREMLTIALAAVKAGLRDDAATELAALRAKPNYKAPDKAIVTEATANAAAMEDVVRRVLALAWVDSLDYSVAPIDARLAVECEQLYKVLKK